MGKHLDRAMIVIVLKCREKNSVLFGSEVLPHVIIRTFSVKSSEECQKSL